MSVNMSADVDAAAMIPSGSSDIFPQEILNRIYDFYFQSAALRPALKLQSATACQRPPPVPLTLAPSLVSRIQRTNAIEAMYSHTTIIITTPEDMAALLQTSKVLHKLKHVKIHPPNRGVLIRQQWSFTLVDDFLRQFHSLRTLEVCLGTYDRYSSDYNENKTVFHSSGQGFSGHLLRDFDACSDILCRVVKPLLSIDDNVPARIKDKLNWVCDLLIGDAFSARTKERVGISVTIDAPWVQDGVDVVERLELHHMEHYGMHQLILSPSRRDRSDMSMQDDVALKHPTARGDRGSLCDGQRLEQPVHEKLKAAIGQCLSAKELVRLHTFFSTRTRMVPLHSGFEDPTLSDITDLFELYMAARRELFHDYAAGHALDFFDRLAVQQNLACPPVTTSRDAGTLLHFMKRSLLTGGQEQLLEQYWKRPGSGKVTNMEDAYFLAAGVLGGMDFKWWMKAFDFMYLQRRT